MGILQTMILEPARYLAERLDLSQFYSVPIYAEINEAMGNVKKACRQIEGEGTKLCSYGIERKIYPTLPESFGNSRVFKTRRDPKFS